MKITLARRKAAAGLLKRILTRYKPIPFFMVNVFPRVTICIETIRFVELQLRSKIAQKDLWDIKADFQQIMQAINNLTIFVKQNKVSLKRQENVFMRLNDVEWFAHWHAKQRKRALRSFKRMRLCYLMKSFLMQYENYIKRMELSCHGTHKDIELTPLSTALTFW